MQTSDIDAVVVYATYAKEDEAIAAAEALLARSLIACANILPAMTSVYIWEGRLERSSEVAVIMKTRRALADEVITMLKTIHSYQTPAIVVWPIENGARDYLGWIGAQTARPMA